MSSKPAKVFLRLAVSFCAADSLRASNSLLAPSSMIIYWRSGGISPHTLSLMTMLVVVKVATGPFM